MWETKRESSYILWILMNLLGYIILKLVYKSKYYLSYLLNIRSGEEWGQKLVWKEIPRRIEKGFEPWWVPF